MTTAIPAVDPTDLERIYELYRAHPGHAIGLKVWVNTCTPGADFEELSADERNCFACLPSRQKRSKTG
jgi:hypothetical protein